TKGRFASSASPRRSRPRRDPRGGGGGTGRGGGGNGTASPGSAGTSRSSRPRRSRSRRPGPTSGPERGLLVRVRRRQDAGNGFRPCDLPNPHDVRGTEPRAERRHEDPRPRSEGPVSGLRTPRRPLGRRIAFSAVAAALLLLAVEATARLFGMPSGLVRRLHEAADMPPDDFAGSVGMFRPAFRGRVGWPPELAFDLAVNRLGLRGPETTLEKPAGTYRILCLGDSTTFGLFVADSEAYPRRLEAALRADLPQIEVLNAGVPGFGTHDQLRFLRERAHRLAPDLVVHLFCQNDLTDIGEDVGGEHGAYARWLARIADHPPWPIRALGATATSELLTRLRIAWKAWRAGVPEHLEPGVLTGPPRAAFRHFEVVHRELARFCSERGIALVTACFPESDV